MSFEKERLELVHKNFPDLDMNVVIPREAFMEEFLRLFRVRFKNTEHYFKQIGLSESEIARIMKKLVDDYKK